MIITIPKQHSQEKYSIFEILKMKNERTSFSYIESIIEIANYLPVKKNKNENYKKVKK